MPGDDNFYEPDKDAQMREWEPSTRARDVWAFLWHFYRPVMIMGIAQGTFDIVAIALALAYLIGR